MKDVLKIADTPVWTWLTIAGLAILALVDRMRAEGIAAESIVLGSLPNPVATALGALLTLGLLPFIVRGRSESKQA